VGTLPYMSPEIFKHNYDQKCDIWAVGVIMYQLLTGDLPFWSDNSNELRNLIIEGNFNQEKLKNLSQ